MSAQDEDYEHTLCPLRKGGDWFRLAGNFSTVSTKTFYCTLKKKKKNQQPMFISIFGFLKRFLSQPSKRMIFLREIKWLNTFNLSLNGTLLNLIIRPYRFWEKTLLFSVTLISLLPFPVRTPRQKRLREKASKDIQLLHSLLLWFLLGSLTTTDE